MKPFMASSVGTALIGLTGAMWGCGPTEAERMAAEQQIYAAVVEALYLGRAAERHDERLAAQVLLMAETHWSGRNAEEHAVMLRDSEPKLPAETVRDFIARNGGASRVPAFQVRGGALHFLADTTVERFFRLPYHEAPGWNGVRQAYPRSAGIMTVSRVGLSPDYEWALVEAGVQRDWLNGNGYLFLFHRVGRRWFIRRQWEMWVS